MTIVLGTSQDFRAPIAIGGSAPPRILEGAPNTTTLTPDALLVYCQTRLRDLDDQVSKAFKTQREVSALSNHIGGVQAAVNAIANEKPDGEGLHPFDEATKKSINASFDEILNDPKLSSDQKAKVQQAKDAFNIGDDRLTNDEVKQINTALDDVTKSISSDSELSMIALQSLMSQRQTAIQLTTNLMNNLNETTKSTVANIK